MPSAAPALVLAIPAAETDAAPIAAGITSMAGSLCPGPAIRAGFAGDGPASLSALLASIATAREAAAGDEAGACPYAAVVIPLAIAPDPGREAWIADAAGQAGPGVTVTPDLGPHPLLAAALHDRLAEAGLVQARRLSGLSLV